MCCRLLLEFRSSPADSRAITPLFLVPRDWRNSCTVSHQSLQVQTRSRLCGGTHLSRLRIIVADDNPAFLQELTSLLKVEFDVVVTAADGKSALDLIRRYKPDLVVLDLGMPVISGLEVTRELAKCSQTPLAVICSVETDPELVEAARQAGAVAYVFKMRVRQDLILAVKSALQGKPFVSPALH